MNEGAFNLVRSAFDSFGDQATPLFQQTIQEVRESLASAMSEAFLIALVLVIAAVVIVVFINEIPVSKRQAGAEEPAPTPQGELPASHTRTGPGPDGRRGRWRPDRLRNSPLLGPINSSAASHPIVLAQPSAAILNPLRSLLERPPLRQIPAKPGATLCLVGLLC